MAMDDKSFVISKLNDARENALPYISCIGKILPTLAAIPQDEICSKAQSLDLKASFFQIEKLELNEELAKFLQKMDEAGVMETVFLTSNNITTTQFKEFIEKYKIKSNIKIAPTNETFRARKEFILNGNVDPVEFMSYSIQEDGTTKLVYEAGLLGGVESIGLLNTPEIDDLLKKNYREYYEQHQGEKEGAEKAEAFVIDKKQNPNIRAVKNLLRNPKGARSKMDVQIDVDQNLDTEEQINVAVNVSHDVEAEVQREEISADNGNLLDEKEALERLRQLLTKRFKFSQKREYVQKNEIMGAKTHKIPLSEEVRDFYVEDGIISAKGYYHPSFESRSFQRAIELHSGEEHNVTIQDKRIEEMELTGVLKDGYIKQIFLNGITHITEKCLLEIAKNIDNFTYGLNLENLPENFAYIEQEDNKKVLYISSREREIEQNSFTIRAKPVKPKLYYPFTNFLAVMCGKFQNDHNVAPLDPIKNMDELAQIAGKDKEELTILICEFVSPVHDRYGSIIDVLTYEKNKREGKKRDDFLKRDIDQAIHDSKKTLRDYDITEGKAGYRLLSEVYNTKGAEGLKKVISMLERIRDNNLCEVFVCIFGSQLKGWSDMLEAENVKALDLALEQIFPENRTPSEKLHFFRSRGAYIQDFDSLFLLNSAYNRFQKLLDDSEIKDKKERIAYLDLFLAPIWSNPKDAKIYAVTLERQIKVLEYAAKHNCLYEQLIANRTIEPGKFPNDVEGEFGKFGYSIFHPEEELVLDRSIVLQPALQSSQSSKFAIDVPYNMDRKKLEEMLDSSEADKLKVAAVRYLAMLPSEQRLFFGEYMDLLNETFEYPDMFTLEFGNDGKITKEIKKNLKPEGSVVYTPHTIKKDHASLFALAALTSTGEFFNPELKIEKLTEAIKWVHFNIGQDRHIIGNKYAAFIKNINRLHKEHPKLDFMNLLHIAAIQHYEGVNQNVEASAAKLAEKYGKNFANYCYNVTNSDKCSNWNIKQSAGGVFSSKYFNCLVLGNKQEISSNNSIEFITRKLRAPDGSEKEIHEILCGDDYPEFLSYLSLIKLPEKPTYQDIVKVREGLIELKEKCPKFWNYNIESFDKVTLRSKEHHFNNVPYMDIDQLKEMFFKIEAFGGVAVKSSAQKSTYEYGRGPGVLEHVVLRDEKASGVNAGIFFEDYFPDNEEWRQTLARRLSRNNNKIDHKKFGLRSSNNKTLLFEGKNVQFSDLPHLLVPKIDLSFANIARMSFEGAKAFMDPDVRELAGLVIEINRLNESPNLKKLEEISKKVEKLQEKLRRKEEEALAKGEVSIEGAASTDPDVIELAGLSLEMKKLSESPDLKKLEEVSKKAEKVQEKLRIKEEAALAKGEETEFSKFVKSQDKNLEQKAISGNESNFINIFKQLAGKGFDGEKEAKLLYNLICDPAKPLHKQILKNGEAHDTLLKLFDKIAYRNPDVDWQKIERVKFLEAVSSKGLSVAQNKLLFEQMSEWNYKGALFGGKSLGDIVKEIDRKYIKSDGDIGLHPQFDIITKFIIENPSIEHLDQAMFYEVMNKLNILQSTQIRKYLLDNKDYRVACWLNSVDEKKINLVLDILPQVNPDIMLEFISLKNSASWVNSLNDPLQIVDLIKIIGGLRSKSADKNQVLTVEQIDLIVKAVSSKDKEFRSEMVALSNLAIKKDSNFIDKFMELIAKDKVEDFRAGAQTIYRDTNPERFKYNVERVCKKIEQISRKRQDRSQLMFVEKATLLNSFITVMELVKNDPVLVKNGKNYAVRDLSNVEIRELITNLKEQYATKPSYDLKLKFVALGLESMYRSTGKFPRDTQVLAVLNTIMREDNMVHEIATGQGKGIVTSLEASCVWFTDCTVDVTTSDKDLSRRDLKEFSPYFDLIGAKHSKSIITVDSKESDYKVGGINYSTASDLTLFRAKIQRDRLKRGEKIITEGKKALVCDEVDAEARNEINYRLADKMTRKFEKKAQLRSLFEVIADFTEDEDKFVNNNVPPDQDVDNLIIYAKNRFNGYLNMGNQYPLKPEVLEQLGKSKDAQQKAMFHLHKAIEVIEEEMKRDEGKDIKSLLNTFIDSACNARMLKRGEDYNLPKELTNLAGELNVIPVVGVTPNEASSFGFGIHQFINLKEEKELNKERALGEKLTFKFDIPTAAVFNKTAKNFFDYYRGAGSRIIGLTGTAGSKGSALNELFKYFKMETYSHPRFEDDRRVMLPSIEANNLEHQKKLLLDQIKKAGRKQHLYNIFRIFMDPPPPLMIFAENQNEAIEFYEHVKAALDKEPRLKKYYDLDKLQLFANSGKDTGDKNAVVSKIGRSRGITICTQELTRGTDALLHDKVNHLYPINLATEQGENDFYQAFGRTGRNGAEGYFVSITNKEKYKGKTAAETRLNVEDEKREKRLKAMPLSEVTDYVQSRLVLSDEDDMKFIDWISKEWRTLTKDVKGSDEKLLKEKRTELVGKVVKEHPSINKDELVKHLEELDKMPEETKQFEHITITKKIEPKYAKKYKVRAEGQETKQVLDETKKEVIGKLSNYLNGKLNKQEHQPILEFIRDVLINLFWPKASDRVKLAKETVTAINAAGSEEELYKVLKEGTEKLIKTDKDINKSRWFKPRNLTGSRLLNLLAEISSDVAEAATDSLKANEFIRGQMKVLNEPIVKDTEKLHNIAEQIMHSKSLNWDQYSARIAAEKIVPRTKFDR